MTRLALLRHGHTPWNRAGRIQGRSDIALDAQARADLAKLRLPAPWSDARLWASPLSRATETATLVAGRPPYETEALIEMHWGDWEGARSADLHADPDADMRHIEDWGWHFRPPGGESPMDLRQRMQPWLATLSGDNVAVCHIGVMRVLLAVAHGWTFSGPAPFQIKRNRLYVIELTDPQTAWPEPVRLEPCS
ncbi:MAG: histidine phosphatase family protein [Pseudomonadota bacterium]